MDGEIEAPRPSTDPHTIVEQAERLVAEQAGITLAEALIRVSLYARFQDQQLVEVCRAIIDGTISLLHYGERKRRPPSTDPAG